MPSLNYLPCLHLLPNALNQDYSNSKPEDYTKVFTPDVIDLLLNTDIWIVENAKVARHFLKQISINYQKNLKTPLQNQLMFDLSDYKHQKTLQIGKQALQNFLNALPLNSNLTIGLLSDAGTPCIADPGHWVVDFFRQKQWRIVPHVGANSIVLALMASGLNGQQFVFHGYLPLDAQAKQTLINHTYQHALFTEYSHLCIETPYRNKHLFDDLLKYLPKHYQLCLASQLTTAQEWIQTYTISAWQAYQKNNTDSLNERLNKVPVLFAWCKQ